MQKIKEVLGDTNYLEFFKKAKSFSEEHKNTFSGTTWEAGLFSHPATKRRLEDSQMGRSREASVEDGPETFQYSSLVSDPEKEF